CICSTLSLSLAPTVFPYTPLVRSFELPRERFIVEVHIDARRHEYEPRIDTVMLLPAKRQLVVVRRSTFTYPYIRTTTRSARLRLDRKSTRLNSSHVKISYAVFCLK